MLRICLLTAFVLVSVRAEGEFSVLHSPESVEFKGAEPLNQSTLKDLITAILGFTVQPHQSWNGVTIKNPFALPEAVVSIVIEGVDSLESSKYVKFALNIDESEERTWQVVRQRLEDRDKNNTLIRIRVGDGFDALGQSSLGELKLNDIERPPTHLNPKNEIDNQFIRDVQLLRAIAQKVLSTINPNSKPDVYWLIVSGLGPVIDSHGKDSLASKEAFKLLDDALEEIHQAFTKAYNDKVVIAAFTSDSNKVRDTRSVEQSFGERQRRQVTVNDDVSEKNNKATDDASSTVKPEDRNLAKKYSKDYPAIFNIILWFGIIFVFSLLAICITIADMDPGRDSIIYRMTSNRMKKDN